MEIKHLEAPQRLLLCLQGRQAEQHRPSKRSQEEPKGAKLVRAATFTSHDETGAWGQIHPMVICMLCATGVDGASSSSPQTATDHGLGGTRGRGLSASSSVEAAPLFGRLK